MNVPFLLVAILPPVLLTGLLWTSAWGTVRPIEVLLTLPMVLLPWASFVAWRRESEERFPLFALVGGMFWIYYGLPVFRIAWTGEPTIPYETLVPALLLSDLGLVCLWCGFRLAPFRSPVSARVPEIAGTPSQLAYVRGVLVVGALLGLSESHAYVFGEGGRNAILLLGDFVPLVAVAYLLRRHLSGQGQRIDVIFLAVYAVLRVMAALASGWLGSAVGFGIVLVIVYLEERRRVPVGLVVAVLAYTLVLQPAKTAFREVFWYGGEQGSRLERLAFWARASQAEWESAAAGEGGKTPSELAAETLSRMSLLEHSALIIEMTPDVVPYQHGRLYSYFLVTLVPRVLWPDKPSINEANRFYQVAYGLTPEWHLDSISIACGFVGEAYINFGWLGVPFVVTLVGMALRWFERNLLEPGNGNLLRAIGVPVVSLFLILESQLAQYFGGLLQRIALALLVFLPVWRLTPRALPDASEPGADEGVEAPLE